MSDEHIPPESSSPQRSRRGFWVRLAALAVIVGLVAVRWLQGATQRWVHEATSVMSSEEDYERAISLLNRAIVLAPSTEVRCEAYDTRSVCNAALGNWTEAAEDKSYVLSCESNRNQIRDRYLRGRYLLRAARTDEAVEDFLAVIDSAADLADEQREGFSPEIAKAHYYVGYAAYQRGDETEAEIQFRTAIGFDPELANWPYDVATQDRIGGDESL